RSVKRDGRAEVLVLPGIVEVREQAAVIFVGIVSGLPVEVVVRSARAHAGALPGAAGPWVLVCIRPGFHSGWNRLGSGVRGFLAGHDACEVLQYVPLDDFPSGAAAP